MNITGEIDAQTFEDLKRVASEGTRLDLRIDSHGGNSAAALEIYDWLKERDVHVLVTGRCYSSALFLAMGAKKIQAYPSARFLVHEPVNHVCGTADVLASESKWLRKLTERVAAAISERTRQPLETVNQWLSTDTHFDAPQAKACGLVDEIVAAPVEAAVADVLPIGNKPGYTASETLLLDFLRALGEVTTHDRGARLRREIAVFLTYNLREDISPTL